MMKNLTICREFYDHLAKVGSITNTYIPMANNLSIHYKDGQETDKEAENYLYEHYFKFLDKVKGQKDLEIFNECGVLSVQDAKEKILAFEAFESPFLAEQLADEIGTQVKELKEKIIDDVIKLNSEVTELDDFEIYYTNENGEESCSLGTLITDDQVDDNIKFECSQMDFWLYRYGEPTDYTVEINDSLQPYIKIRWTQLFKAQFD